MVPIKVLVIDDEPLILKSTALLLKSMKMEPVLAHNGKEGLEKAGSEHPDLIFLDLNMPGLSGLDVLKLLKTTANLVSIPVVVFTADDVSFSARTLMEKGASGLCPKPFEPQKLFDIVNNLVGKLRAGSKEEEQ